MSSSGGPALFTMDTLGLNQTKILGEAPMFQTPFHSSIPTLTVATGIMLIWWYFMMATCSVSDFNFMYAGIGGCSASNNLKCGTHLKDV